MATKLILAQTEAVNYVKFLLGFTTELQGGSQVWIGLGNVTIGENGAVFEEIPVDTAATNDTKTTNYARVQIKSAINYPDVLTVDSKNPRRIYNHEQIVFNKVLKTAYTANAIAFYRLENSATPYAFGILDSVLDAAVGSLPMFEREKLELEVPDGSDIELPADPGAG